MSVRKTAAAKVATKPTGGRSAEPAKRTHPKKHAKPPPAEPASRTTTGGMSAAAEKLAANIECALAEGHTDVLTIDAIQALMAAACRSYSAQVEAGGNFPPIPARSRVTSTDVMITASGLLKAANLAVFELGMWQSWTGR
jgi:hypothetical protein